MLGSSLDQWRVHDASLRILGDVLLLTLGSVTGVQAGYSERSLAFFREAIPPIGSPHRRRHLDRDEISCRCLDPDPTRRVFVNSPPHRIRIADKRPKPLLRKVSWRSAKTTPTAFTTGRGRHDPLRIDERTVRTP